MGWWKVEDVSHGGIDWDYVCPDSPGTVNAIPGKSATTEIFNGDGPADVMDEALEQIIELYIKAWGRPAKEEELQAVFNFCMGGYTDEEENI